jgi:hypothetical protein
MLAVAALTVVVTVALLPVDDVSHPEAGTYPGLGPLGPTLPCPLVDAITWALSIPWMLGMLLAPALLWRSVPRSAGRCRPRVALAAVSSLLPICTVLVCVTSIGLATAAGLLPADVAASALGLAYGAAFLLAPVGLAVAVAGSDTVVARTAPRMTGAALTAVLGTLSTIVIVFVSTLVSAQVGSGAMVPVVLATLAVAAALVPVHRRVVRELTLRLDPGRDGADDPAHGDGRSRCSARPAPAGGPRLGGPGRRHGLRPGPHRLPRARPGRRTARLSRHDRRLSRRGRPPRRAQRAP